MDNNNDDDDDTLLLLPLLLHTAKKSMNKYLFFMIFLNIRNSFLLLSPL